MIPEAFPRTQGEIHYPQHLPTRRFAPPEDISLKKKPPSTLQERIPREEIRVPREENQQASEESREAAESTGETSAIEDRENISHQLTVEKKTQQMDVLEKEEVVERPATLETSASMGEATPTQEQGETMTEEKTWEQRSQEKDETEIKLTQLPESFADSIIVETHEEEVRTIERQGSGPMREISPRVSIEEVPYGEPGLVEHGAFRLREHGSQVEEMNAEETPLVTPSKVSPVHRGVYRVDENASRETEPVVNIRIGRIEVKAVQSESHEPDEGFTPSLRLERYLKERERGER